MLKSREISEDVYNDILKNFTSRCIPLDDKSLKKKFNGYENKWLIYYNNKYLICQGYLIDPNAPNTWEQYRCVLNTGLKSGTIEYDPPGSLATNFICKILKKYYTIEEIEQCLSSHEAEYDENLKQLHYIYKRPEMPEGKILKFENCVEYDINGAYNDALIDIFPKAEKALTKLYLDRHKKPINKKFINYYTGNLCNLGHRKTYNWIVQRVRKKMNETIEKCDGTWIYANTDGVILQRPKNFIETKENSLGDYKLEYSGTVYGYFGNGKYNDRYIIIQTDKIRGTVSTEVRKDIDLSKGRLVHYNKKHVINPNTGKVAFYEIINKEIVEGVEIINEEN